MTHGDVGRSTRTETCNAKWFSQSVEATSKQSGEGKGSAVRQSAGGPQHSVFGCMLNVSTLNKPHRPGDDHMPDTKHLDDKPLAARQRAKREH